MVRGKVTDVNSAHFWHIARGISRIPSAAINDFIPDAAKALDPMVIWLLIVNDSRFAVFARP